MKTREGPVLKLLAIRHFRQLSTRRPDNRFTMPDRAARYLIQKRVEQIEVARRYWACPF
jgi:hypothetical protein